MDEGRLTPLRRLQTTLRYLLGLAAITHRFIALRTLKLNNQVKWPIAIFMLSLHTNGKAYNPPVNSFQRRATIERAEDMDWSMSDFRPRSDGPRAQ